MRRLQADFTPNLEPLLGKARRCLVLGAAAPRDGRCLHLHRICNGAQLQPPMMLGQRESLDDSSSRAEIFELELSFTVRDDPMMSAWNRGC